MMTRSAFMPGSIAPISPSSFIARAPPRVAAPIASAALAGRRRREDASDLDDEIGACADIDRNPAARSLEDHAANAPLDPVAFLIIRGAYRDILRPNGNDCRGAGRQV